MLATDYRVLKMFVGRLRCSDILDEIRESRKSVSESLVRIPLKSLAPEPAIDSVGDCLPSGLNHHHVAHVGEQFGVGLVKAR